ncbi:MAG: AAA family ATPase [Candidatus Diapherotrites archaeon]|nr:AAA family ATPase [Candidatus Diapherotrites archaeon]
MAKNLIIGGMSGSGKSTQVKLLAQKFKMKPIFTSKLFRELQKQDLQTNGFWEKQGGTKFLQQRLNNLSADKAFDKKLLEISAKGNFVMDSWTMPWLMDKDSMVAVWLEASPETRAKRVAKRNKQTQEEVLKAIKEKEELSKRIYYQAYGIKFGEDLKPFSIVLNTDNLSEKKVFAILSAFVQAVLKK